MTSVPSVDAPLHLLDAPLPAGEQAPSVLEAHAFPDDTAAWAASTQPGADVLVPLAAMPLGRLSADGQIDAVAAMSRQKAWLAAQELRLLATMDRSRANVLGKNYIHEEVGAATGVSPLSAANRMNFARCLVRHPGVLAAMESGSWSENHAKAFVDETHRLDDAEAAAVEQRMIARESAGAVGEFRKAVKRAVLTVAAKTAEERHVEARATRMVEFQALPDGMESTWMVQPAEISAAIRGKLAAEVAKIPAGDPRTADQRRADAYANLILNPDGEVQVPSRQRLHAGVGVTVPLDTVLGLSDAPGELAGYGPILASVSRQLAADETATLRRLVTDELGKLVDYGRSTYRPPAALARHIRGRDVTCCFPNCARPAVSCEIDHCVDWVAGGETNPDNLVALCARHHHLKHDTAWHYDLREDGSVIWTSPTGHTYTRPAQRYPITVLDGRPPPEPPPKKPDPPPLPDDPPF
ncbi:MAG TPA: DUF222 domain-containing protein [Jatrophihabitantaceae bacterium]|nr:DUF222 domain-containing protein [Jatrophihabitantaceae bacterium]